MLTEAQNEPLDHFLHPLLFRPSELSTARNVLTALQSVAGGAAEASKRAEYRAVYANLLRSLLSRSCKLF